MAASSSESAGFRLCTEQCGGMLRRCGHQPVALVGGATGLVGDPSGKSAERPALSETEVNHPERKSHSIAYTMA